MFEIRKDIEVKEEIFNGSKIFTIDNFYEDPDSVLDYALNPLPPLWKMEDQPSYNNVYFEDRHSEIFCKEVEPVFYFLQSLCNQDFNNFGEFEANVSRFKKDSFNDYKNCYWIPHNDIGYGAIVYLNKDDTKSGTNFYECLDPENEPPEDITEHQDPWRPKEKYKVIKHIEPKYNRMVLYDGMRFLHGMNICNDDYFSDTYRVNQVYFFEY